MAQQIEPIEIFGKENKGEYLYAYKPFSFTETKIMVVEILDKDGYSLFSSNLTAETIEEVAEKLSLTLITDTMDNRKELLTEIMEADAKDELYQTTTYEKLDQLLVLCNEIIEDILSRRVVATDLLEVSENHGLECLSTHIPDEDRINNIKKELKKLDDSINNKL